MSVGIVALALTGPVEVSTFDPADMPTLPTNPPHPYGVTAIQNEALGQVLYRQFSERFRAYTFVVKDELLVKDGFGHYDHATAGEARTLGVEAAAYAGVTAGAVPEGYLTDVFDPADVPLGPPGHAAPVWGDLDSQRCARPVCVSRVHQRPGLRAGGRGRHPGQKPDGPGVPLHACGGRGVCGSRGVVCGGAAGSRATAASGDGHGRDGGIARQLHASRGGGAGGPGGPGRGHGGPDHGLDDRAACGAGRCVECDVERHSMGGGRGG